MGRSARNCRPELDDDPPRTAPPRGAEPYPDAYRLGCQSYYAGHNVHWIQALRTANRPEVWRESWVGDITEIEGGVIRVTRRGGRRYVFRNHDLERLVAINGGTRGGEVLVNEQFAILRIGTFCFSVTQGQLSPCIGEEPPADPSDAEAAALLETHGGFTRPGNVSGTRENGGLGGSQ
jgi:hypothetical protein